MQVPPRLIFVNRYFHPDHSATSQIVSDLAFHLAECGWQVSVIAGRQRYDAPDVSLPNRERVRGVDIRRVFATRFGRTWLPGRAIDYLTFSVSAAWALLRLTKRGTVVVLKTDPPLFPILAEPLIRWRGGLTVNWLQDVYPEIAAALGVGALTGPLGRLLRRLRNRALRRARLNVAIGEDMAGRLRREGVSADTIRVLTNWADDEGIRPVPPEENPLRAAWGLDGKFVVAYSGNLGRAHDVETVVSAAGALADRDDIVFLFIGGGHETHALKERLGDLGVRAVFKPYQPRDDLSRSLSVGDVHWLSLKASLDGLIQPSKFYGILAAGRPVLVIGSEGSELGRLVEEAGCGRLVPLGAGKLLAGTLAELAADSAACAQMGARARRLLEGRFTRAETLRAWQLLLAAVSAGQTLPV